jgi:hypothetical protein
MLTLILAIFFQIISISEEYKNNNKNSLESITGYSIIEIEDNNNFSNEAYYRYYLFIWGLLITIGLLSARLIIPRIKSII